MHEKILVIEDDVDILSNLRDLLLQEGYQTYTAINGKDGIASALGNPPDLILCDIMMPKADGFQVKERLQNYPSTIGIPFIFLTAKTTISDIRKGMISGADDYIVKPYNARELLDSIQTRLQRKEDFITAAAQLKPEAGKKFNYDDRTLVKFKNQSVFIKISDIVCISASSEYSQIELKSGEKHMVRKLLRDWEITLPENEFIRIHRSTIININYVSKIENWYKRSMKLNIACINKEFIVSQRYTSKIKAKLGA